MFRQLEAKDLPELDQMLREEGTIMELKEMMPINTYVWDDGFIKGFFHFRFEHSLPSLRHLCIKKEFRNIKNAAKIIDEWKRIIKSLGFKLSIVIINKPYLQKLVEYKLKKKQPYEVRDNIASYIVEV